MGKRTRKAVRPVRDASKLAKGASKRQKRLYGLNGAKVPHHERWRLEIDAKYAAALAKDPVAAQWLSAYNEEVHRGMYIAGEPHLHTLEQLRELDRERKARAANEDVMAFEKYRGWSLEEVQAYLSTHRYRYASTMGRPGDGDNYGADDWLFDNTGGRVEDEEDQMIAGLDRKRSLVLRKGGKS